MGRFVIRVFGAALMAMATLAIPGSDVSAAPSEIETVDVLTDVLEALRADDDDGYEAAAEELRNGGHWLPAAGWHAVDARDDEQLSFVWLLLDASGLEPLLMAFDQVVVERDLVSTVSAVSTASAADLAFMDVIDADGVAILEVLDHRRIGISPEARAVLGPLPIDGGAQLPPVESYDQVLAMMMARLDEAGYQLPEVGIDLDQIELPTPNGGLPTPPPSSPASRPGAASPSPNTSGDAPTATDTTEPTAADDGGVDPTTLVFGAIALLAVALAAVAMRRSGRSNRLADIAFTDGLTGLHNRRRLDSDLLDTARNGARPTALLMIDVDHFKQINDAHGHAVGDDVLRRVAEVISRNVRTNDLPYRYGGEEFCVLLPDTEHAEADEVGERVRAAIEDDRVPLPDGTEADITVSLGLAAGHAADVEQLVRDADRALYAAKTHGRNRLARL